LNKSTGQLISELVTRASELFTRASELVTHWAIL
jgi:hypothetical protein